MWGTEWSSLRRKIVHVTWKGFLPDWAFQPAVAEASNLAALILNGCFSDYLENIALPLLRHSAGEVSKASFLWPVSPQQTGKHNFRLPDRG